MAGKRRPSSVSRTSFDPAAGDDPAFNGFDLPVDAGYDVKASSKVSPGDGDWTVRLTSPRNEIFDLWADQIETSFSLTGVTGQARFYRQFYPRAFARPSLIISGPTPNQKEYNALAKFVRSTHFQALTTADQVALGASGYRSDSSGALLSTKLHVRSQKNPEWPQRLQHRAMHLEGFITTIKAGAEKNINAPRYQFEFTIAESLKTSSGKTGLYSDTLVTGSQILSWLDQFNKFEFGNISTKGGLVKTHFGGGANLSPLVDNAVKGIVQNIDQFLNGL